MQDPAVFPAVHSTLDPQPLAREVIPLFGTGPDRRMPLLYQRLQRYLPGAGGGRRHLLLPRLPLFLAHKGRHSV